MVSEELQVNGLLRILVTGSNLLQSNLADVKCGVSQDSILGPLLFLIYIHDLHTGIKYSEVHHFADDTNLLNFNSFVKTIMT